MVFSSIDIVILLVLNHFLITDEQYPHYRDDDRYRIALQLDGPDRKDHRLSSDISLMRDTMLDRHPDVAVEITADATLDLKWQGFVGYTSEMSSDWLGCANVTGLIVIPVIFGSTKPSLTEYARNI